MKSIPIKEKMYSNLHMINYYLLIITIIFLTNN